MAGVKPSAQAKNIYELFAGKVFKVPDYQRNYAWSEKNWEDFWNDLKDGLLTCTEHYWGTITLKATGKTFYCSEKEIPFNLFEVVDGQQRITTIYLFLLALANVGKPALRDSFIKCGTIYRLELGGFNNQFLKDLIDGKNPQPTIKTNKLLKNCLEYFENQIRAFNKLDELSRYLQNTTFSLEFVVQDKILAVKAFESLNDRGKPLTLLDKTKSYLMFISLRYLDNALYAFVNNTFGNIFANYDIIKEIGEQENVDYLKNRFTEDEFLRFFYHYFARYAIEKYSLPIGFDFDITARAVFEIFLKTSCKHLRANQQDLKNFIKEFLENINKFINAFKDIVEQIKANCNLKKLFSFLGLNTRVYPLLISLKAENLLSERMLKLIEVLDLRVYKVRGTDPRARLYKEVISQIRINSNSTQIENGIKSFINEFMPDSLFQHYLNQNIYDNPATKFILWEYEKYRNPSFNDCTSSTYADCQKEHIFAQNPKPTFPSYGFSTEEDYFANIDRLGNLCLIEERLNKQCQNKLPDQKKQYYQQSQIPGTRQLGFDIDNSGFTKEDIDTITKDILSFCLERWKI